METRNHSWKKWLISIALAALTITAYWELRDNNFVSYDDDVYVTANAHVQRGLTLDNIGWALTSTSAANWHPLTWLSHMLDWELYGKNPAGHHITNLLIHMANVVLLFWLLEAMTGGLWQSAIVAALFAIHPLSVETVAWVAERKNVLSTLFWILTIWAYVWHARKPSWGRYSVVLLLFVMALMSKPMVVTLPLVLMLLDYWPLNRLKRTAETAPTRVNEKRTKRARPVKAAQSYPSLSLKQLVIEKLPLLLLALISSLVTVIAQRAGGAVGTIEAFPLLVRCENAVVSYARYLLDMIWPLRLAVFYPHPQHSLPKWQLAMSAVVLVGLTVIVITHIRKAGYLSVGWLWYGGTLVPVIGIVQVGLQSRADRYAYIPLIGIFIMIVWPAWEWISQRRRRRQVAAVAVAGVVIALTAATRSQVLYWTTSVTLFERALAVTENNYVAHNNLGESLAQQGRLDDAEAHFAAAIQINPLFADAHHNMGMSLVRRGKPGDAIAEFTRAIEIAPNFTDAHNKLGAALANQGNLSAAIASFSRALEIDPNYASARANLGSAYEQQGRTREAIEAYSEALPLIADAAMSAQIHFKLGRLLEKSGRKDEASQHYREAVRLKPDYAQAQQALTALEKTIAN